MNNICQICGETMVLRPAGISKKTGRPYEEFWSCPNYKTHPKTTYEPIKETSDQIIIDELQEGFKELNARLDKMAEYLVKHLK